jgi:hypothetical protein
MPQEIILDQHYRPFGAQASLGNNRDVTVIHKFGRNAAVGTSFVPVTMGGVYQTPQVGGATTLRLAAGNVADAAAGTGAREVTLQGLDASGNAITDTLTPNGVAASTATSLAFLRLYRAWVSSSGTYATSAAGSHAADIVVENSAGGTTWATISSTDYPRSQSEIGAYSVPSGYKAIIPYVAAFTDSSKITSLLFFRRSSILQTAPPYDAMRVVLELTTNGGESEFRVNSPLGPFVGPCDIGVMAKVDSTTAEVDVEFEIWLVAQ